jgi:hypothetical protein
MTTSPFVLCFLFSSCHQPKILEIFELCMSGQLFRIFLLSSFAQIMKAFIGRFICVPPSLSRLACLQYRDGFTRFFIIVVLVGTGVRMHSTMLQGKHVFICNTYTAIPSQNVTLYHLNSFYMEPYFKLIFLNFECVLSISFLMQK